MRILLTTLLGLTIFSCGGRQPDAVTIKQLLREHADDFEKLRNCLLVDEAKQDKGAIAVLMEKCGVLRAKSTEHSPVGGVWLLLFSEGTVAMGTSVAIIWFPDSQKSEFERIVSERDGRTTYSALGDNWVMQVSQ